MSVAEATPVSGLPELMIELDRRFGTLPRGADAGGYDFSYTREVGTFHLTHGVVGGDADELPRWVHVGVPVVTGGPDYYHLADFATFWLNIPPETQEGILLSEPGVVDNSEYSRRYPMIPQIRSRFVVSEGEFDGQSVVSVKFADAG